ncbi:MAG: endonuclease [Bacteroidaceae bacterium]|nr:endonuclease [Bacteroidaceae bacterium]
MKFTTAVKEALQYYVYCLVDPRDNKIFYIGKGIGDRVFQHAEDALNENLSSLKLDTIRDIISNGLEVKYFIIRHGLDESSAFLVESTLIDLLTYEPVNTEMVLTNIVSGHHQWDKGIKTVNEIFEIYDCKPIEVDEKDSIIFININRSYGTNAKDEYKRPSLYEATRKSWVLKPERANKANLVLAVYRGVVRGVFKPTSKWYNAEEEGYSNRYMIDAVEVTDSPYLNKSVVDLFTQSQNPIHYYNC